MQEESHLQLIKKTSGKSLRCILSRARLASFESDVCLVVSISGELQENSEQGDGYEFIHQMIGDGFAACNPATLILDLSELKYSSSDRMLRLLDQRITTKTVASDLNRQQLSNLISGTLFLDPKAELFDSIAHALTACDAAYIEFIRAGRKKIIANDF